MPSYTKTGNYPIMRNLCPLNIGTGNFWLRVSPLRILETLHLHPFHIERNPGQPLARLGLPCAHGVDSRQTPKSN